MAIVHENLYQSDDLSKIDFAHYVKKFVNELLNSYEISPSSVRPVIDVENSLMDINFAIPCGLIINELVSNSIKHAFTDGIGEINIKFNIKDGKKVLIVSDNGVGFPQELDFQNTNTLGLQLVNALVKQLYGTIELYRDEGTKFKIIF